MHFHCECLVNDIEVQEPHSPEFQQARLIYSELLAMGLRPFRSELSMYSTILQCAGQADLIMRAPDGSLIVADWKRTKQLAFENSFGRLKYPLCHLPDTTVDGTDKGKLRAGERPGPGEDLFNMGAHASAPPLLT